MDRALASTGLELGSIPDPAQIKRITGLPLTWAERREWRAGRAADVLREREAAERSSSWFLLAIWLPSLLFMAQGLYLARPEGWPEWLLVTLQWTWPGMVLVVAAIQTAHLRSLRRLRELRLALER